MRLVAPSGGARHRDECRMELQTVNLQVAGSNPAGSPKGPVAQRTERAFHHPRRHGRLIENTMANAGETTSVTRKGSGFEARAVGDPAREDQRMFPSSCRHGRTTAANAGRNYSLLRNGWPGRFDSCLWRRSLARAGPSAFRPPSSPLPSVCPANAGRTTGESVPPISAGRRMFNSSRMAAEAMCSSGNVLPTYCCRG